MDLDELERLARAATPGPWEANNADGLCVNSVTQWRMVTDMDPCTTPAGSPWRGRMEDAAYIAALSPDVALALVARVRELEAEVARLRLELRQEQVREEDREQRRYHEEDER